MTSWLCQSRRHASFEEETVKTSWGRAFACDFGGAAMLTFPFIRVKRESPSPGSMGPYHPALDVCAVMAVVGRW